MGGFSDLVVWREAASLAAEVEAAVEFIKGRSATASADQMVRAANSIPANIAEGYGRGVNLDCIRFLKIAKSSANELESHVRVAAISRRLPVDAADGLVDHVRRVGYLIHRFQQSVERRRR
jgi:four helix bundle protein